MREADHLIEDLEASNAKLLAAENRIRELEGDQEVLFEDVERLNGCLTRAYEMRKSAQERLASARAEIIRLRGIVRGDAPATGPAAASPGEEQN
jgi:chromosome segregation ATPase